MSGRGFACRWLAAALAAVALSAGAATVDLDVALDPAARTLSGQATLRFAADEQAVFALASDAVIERASVGGRDVNRELVRSGAAIASGDYEAEEREARSQRRGVWATRFEQPADWRARH